MQPYERLEKEFGEWMGYEPEQTVSCSSGTSALHLALEALPIPKGSKVIVPDFTMIACARACTLAGLVPTFVDCDERLLLQTNSMGRYDDLNFSEDVYAIMPVHVYGRQCDMRAVHSLAAEGGWFVVEDLAEAHGLKPHADTHAACWSFYKNKIVAGEEGGMIAFRNPEHASLARKLRCLGFTNAHDFTHIPRGINARLSNAHAELILESLHRVEASLEMRAEIAELYDEYLSGVEGIEPLPPRNVTWVYDLLLPASANQDGVVAYLNTHGTDARHGFKPLSRQPEYYDLTVPDNTLAQYYAERLIYLPVRPPTTHQQMRYATDLLARTLRTGASKAP